MKTICIDKKNLNDLDNAIEIDKIDIDSLFDLEEETFKKINKLENKIKEIDVIYLKYDSYKDIFKKRILNDKNLLIRIQTKKEEYENGNKKDKLLFLKKEYKILLRLSNYNYLVNRINDIMEKIDILIKDDNDNNNNNLINRYNKIKARYDEILSILKSNLSNKNTSYEIDIDSKIKMYQYEIKRVIKKMMIFDNYLFSLDNLYKDVIEKRMLDITVK